MEIKDNQLKYPHPVFNDFLKTNELVNFIIKHINPDSHVFIICDSNTDIKCFPLINKMLKNLFLFNKIVFPEGEKSKNLDTCRDIWNYLSKKNAKKDTLIINLGGGVVSDIGGFCASLYMRGVSFINIPTSLMGMVDASIGGKTGIDSNLLKNNIGNFSFPLAVFIDSEFLKTLPGREYNSGFIEMLKHGLISDAYYFYDLVRGKYESNMSAAIEKSVKLKMKVISEDPYEKGKRKTLNFGHTTGHAIESSFLKYSGKTLLHGEAVLLGMIAESYISKQKGILSPEDFNEISYFLTPLKPKINIQKDDIEDIMSFLLHDKKHTTKQLNFTLLEKPGSALINQNVELKLIRQSLQHIAEL
ncbi:MAG: 3-dehydroquinate synthase [Bacteroidales bacterium]